jgi:hypothetical protein
MATATTLVIQTLQNLFALLMIDSYKAISNLLSVFDPRPLAPLLRQSIAILFATSSSFFSFVVQTILQVYVLQFTITSLLLHTLIQLSLITITALYTITITFIRLIQQVIVQTTHMLLWLIDLTIKTGTALIGSITHAIITTAALVWHKIVLTIQAVVTFLETPFRVTGIYYKKAEPSIIYFFSLIKHATEEFTTTAAALFQLPSELAKQTPK